MSRSRIIAIIAAAAIQAAAASAASAQRFCLEFKGGAAATSTINSQASKSIADSRIGIQMGAGFGYILPAEFLRAYGECYYTAKGEKYSIPENGGNLSSEISYFSIYPSLRYYTPYIPAYAGAGLYISAAASRKMDGPASQEKYYKGMDFGPKAAIGVEIGVGSVRLVIEAAYEYGFVNIAKQGGLKVKNQTLCLSAGISFMLSEKNFKPY